MLGSRYMSFSSALSMVAYSPVLSLKVVFVCPYANGNTNIDAIKNSRRMGILFRFIFYQNFAGVTIKQCGAVRFQQDVLLNIILKAYSAFATRVRMYGQDTGAAVNDVSLVRIDMSPGLLKNISPEGGIC